jgi:hypothetical protein
MGSAGMTAIGEEQAVREVSLRDLVARHPDQEGLRLMTIKAYFDGSGKAHDPHVKYVVLAGYVGTEDVWLKFERRWNRFKAEYGIDYFHASELGAGKGHYYGYGPEQGAIIVARLIDLLRGFSEQEFSAVAYSVCMIDYRTITKKLPKPEAICGSGCLDDLCALVPAEHELQVFYDRGESFLTELQNKWRNKKDRGADQRLNRINVFSEVDDWRKYPALQAADYLAWCIAKGEEFGFDLAMLTSGLAFYGKGYGKSELEEMA